MCGICGFFARNVLSEPPNLKNCLYKMTNSLLHRGPDEDGYYIDYPVFLGHRRLSIIDLSTGHQPISNEDDSVTVVFNGEIYNFSELRTDLIRKGHIFKTNTDTEVIVHAYEEYGFDCLKYFNGMFAFALRDKRQGLLFLVRDRLGVKPLYYLNNDKLFAFTSELKALKEIPFLSLDVDPNAVDLYLFFGYIPAPGTIFHGVKKLLPGHYLIVSRNGIVCRSYWDINSNSSREPISEAGLGQEVRDTFMDAVHKRLISDVSLGAFLSGGIDSSAVVCAMARFMNRPVKTFSIGFKEKEFSELADARLVANYIGSEHHEFIVEPEHADLLQKLVWHLDEPFADSSALPTYYLSRMTRDYVTVALSGDGGDELFGGYRRYLASPAERVAQFMPAILARPLSALGKVLPEAMSGKHFLEALTSGSWQAYANKIGCFPDLRSRLYSDDLLTHLGQESTYFKQYFEPLTSKDPLLAMSFFDLKAYLPDDILVKVDRMSMAVSLEARNPLLDYRLVELAFSIPSYLKIKNGETKYIFKKAIAGLVPPAVFRKKKQGFGVPLKFWFKDDLQEYISQILLDRVTLQRGYFKAGMIKNILRWHKEGHRDYSYWIWALLMLELWHRAFWDKH